MPFLGWPEALIWLAYLALVMVPAEIARRKGRSFLLFFIFGLFLIVPALIVAFLVSDRRAAGPG